MYDIKDVTDVSRVFSVLLCSVEVRLATANTNQQIQTKDSTKMIATVNHREWDDENHSFLVATSTNRQIRRNIERRIEI